MTLATSKWRNATRTNLTPLREWGYTDWALVVAMVLQGIVDTAITLPHWHLEGNALLLAIGPTVTAAFKLSLAVFVLYLWFATDLRKQRYLAPFCWFLLLLYSVVVATNLVIVL